MDIIIVGAGIGGLTAAALLLQRGHRVRVVEQSRALGEIGAGLQLSANAVKVLKAIGLEEALESKGVKPIAAECRRFDDGVLLFRRPHAGAHFSQYGAHYYTIHRADLHVALARAVQNLGPKTVHLGYRVTGVAADNSGVSLSFASSEPMRADLVIGADGIKSVVSQHALGIEDKPEFTGQIAWRLIVPVERIAPELRTDVLNTMWCGYGKYALMYYLRGGKLINFIGCLASTWNEESWTACRSWEELDRDYEGWHPTIRAVIDSADRDKCYCWALHSRAPASVWSTARVTMLGDAVHAMLPNLAQGAAMAIEDAAVLSQALDLNLPLADALKRYERHRSPRTSRVVRESAAATNFFQFRSETTEEMRQYFKDGNFGSRDWLYSYDALGVDLASMI